MSLDNSHFVQSYSRHMKLQISLKPSGVSVNWMTTGHKQHFYLLLDLNIKISCKILTWFSPQNLTDTECHCTNPQTLRRKYCCGQDASRRKINPGDNLMSAGRVVGSLILSLSLWRGKQSVFEFFWHLLPRFRKILYSLHVFMLGKYPEHWLLGNSLVCYLGTGGLVHC